MRRQGLRSRIVLAVHDSIVCECPPEEVAYVYDHLLPWSMGWGTPVVPTDFDGNPTGKGPYFFGVSVNVYKSWGIEVKNWREECAAAVVA
jgi:hypothetical protein